MNLLLLSISYCRFLHWWFEYIFSGEYKYDQTVYHQFMESFDTLPVAATINGKFIAVHGGLSPELKSLGQILNLNRFQEPPREDNDLTVFSFKKRFYFRDFISFFFWIALGKASSCNFMHGISINLPSLVFSYPGAEKFVANSELLNYWLIFW